jgi:hypothetical protein
MKKSAILLLFFAVSIITRLAVFAAPYIPKNTVKDSQMRSATIPFRLDHNRIIIAASVYLPGGKIKRIKVWVDNGTPDMSVSERLANELGLTVKHGKTDENTTAAPPEKILIGGLQIGLGGLHKIEVEKGGTVGSGMEVDMNLPASVLCDYDVIIDYPGKQMTISAPGRVQFKGKAVQAYFNPQNHLIQIPANTGNDHFNLALDIGTPVTFVDSNLVSKLSRDHPSWPSMHGAAGITNLWGLDDEPTWQVLRIAQMSFGGISFRDVIMVSFPADRLDYFQKRAGISTAGLMGAASLLNYRLGIDYHHGVVYFERLTKPADPGMNLVGITLRPEGNGSYSVLGVPLYKGQSAVASIRKGDILLKVDGKKINGLTMGAVWSRLRGSSGTIHKLTIVRQGKKLRVNAIAHCFLCNSLP